MQIEESPYSRIRDGWPSSRLVPATAGVEMVPRRNSRLKSYSEWDMQRRVNHQHEVRGPRNRLSTCGSIGRQRSTASESDLEFTSKILALKPLSSPFGEFFFPSYLSVILFVFTNHDRIHLQNKHSINIRSSFRMRWCWSMVVPSWCWWLMAMMMTIDRLPLIPIIMDDRRPPAWLW